MIKLLAVVLSLSLSGMCQLAFPAFGSVSSGSSSIPSSGLQLWYRGDNLTCTGGCSGTNTVTSLNDLSSNANNCTAAGTTIKYAASAVNSKPGFTFDGSSLSYCSFSSIAWNGGGTSFVVVAFSATNHEDDMISGVTQAFAHGGCRQTSGGIEQYAGSENVAYLGHGTAACDTSYHQLGVTFCDAVVTNCTGGGSASNNLQFYIASTTDGSASTVTGSQSFNNNSTFGKAAVNASAFLTGTVTEIIFYNRVLSSSEISTVQAYLHGRYGT